MRQYRAADATPWLGTDAEPLQAAARALLDGRDIYAVRAFVYPPSAAFLALPLVLVPHGVLVHGSAVVGMLALVLLGAGSVRLFAPARAWRPALGGLAAAGLLAGVAAHHTLALGNASLPVDVAVVALVALWGGAGPSPDGRWPGSPSPDRRWWGGRWSGGCALLVATLLLKPLLAPLVLVPLLARRWRPVVAASAAGAVVGGACLLATVTPGAALRVARRLWGGSVLVGNMAVNNYSLAGLGVMHHTLYRTVLAERLIVVALVVVVCASVALRPTLWDRATVAWLCTLLLAGVFLAARLSEVHYLFALVPGAVGLVAAARPLLARVLAAAALGAVSWPHWHWTSLHEQALWVGVEVALLLASASALLLPRRVQAACSRGTPRSWERASMRRAASS